MNLQFENKRISCTALRYGTTTLGEEYIFSNGKKGNKVVIALMFFLVELGEKYILIDVGCDEMPGFDLIEHKSPVAVLEEYGIGRNQVTDIILTHTHGDHADCIFYYPNANVYVNKREKDCIKSKLLKSQKLKTFDKTCHIADGVCVKYVGGHSVGSSIVEIRTQNQKFIFVGDECYHKNCFEKINETKSMCDANKTKAFLKKYGKNKYKTIVFHDDTIVNTLGSKLIFDCLL